MSGRKKQKQDLSAIIEVKSTGERFKAVPVGFGMRLPDGKELNRSQYRIIKRSNGKP